MGQTLLRLAAFALMLSSPLPAAAQSGALMGTVRDASTGEELVGVNVLIVGTGVGAVTDLQGRYTLKNVPAEPFDLRFSYVGYAPGVITGVRVPAGGSLTMNMDLTPDVVTTEEVVVTAERQLSTESALLAQRKKSATIGDAVSIEQVKRSPDATSGDALKRVTGVTVFDNKFVFVRGVTDRYNSAMLNGVSVTSTDTDVDKKSFAFDLIPANLLENMTVTKTATPDLPGDFTGGLVQLNTLDFPDRRVTKLSLSASSNTLTTLGTVQRSQGSGTDWTGRDGGARAFPGNDVDVAYDLARRLPNSWGQMQKRAPLNGSANFSIGDRVNLGDDVFGYVAGLSYRNGVQRTEAQSLYERLGTVIIDGSGTRDAYSVLWGGLLNLSYQLSGMHKLTVSNSYSRSAEDKVTRNTYQDENEELNVAELVEWDQRANHVAQLSGTHLLPDLGGLEVAWRGAYTSSIAEEPDRKESVFAKPLRAPASFPYQFESARRSWSNLREFARSAGMDFTLPLWGTAKLRFGGLAEGKSRNFDIRFFQVDSRNVVDGTILSESRETIFRPENFGPGKFFMLENSSPRDIYSGTQDLLAAYISVDDRFSLLEQELRFVGGARMENSEQLVNTLSPFFTNVPFIARVKNIDVLPSMNLTWAVNDVTNLRVAYSQSVNRPEFRELSAFYFYDFNTFEGTFGNPLLRRALSRNYDVRFEFFPDVAEVFAVSYFYKGITNAIEVKIIPSTNPERTWFNSEKGKNYGWEIELRKSLGFLGSYFRNLSVGANYTRVYSAIEYEVGEKIRRDSTFVDVFRTETREMQGQSPYSINLFVGFTEPALGTAVTLLYNEFGERIDAIGDERQFDILEQPRGVFDLSVTQPVIAGLEVKVTVKDLAAKRREYLTREGRPYRSVFQGRTYSLQASLSL